MPRNTFAKGLKKYSFETIEDELQTAWSSIYRYWWAFLSCSRDYWWVCKEQGNTLDPELKRVYESFGADHLRGFSSWWSSAARDNFREQFDPPKVGLVENIRQLNRDDFSDQQWMVIRVPLNLKEEKLVDDFVQVLRSHPHRVYHREQTAKYPVLKYKNIHEEVLGNVCDLWHEVNRQGGITPGNKQKGARDSYYEIGVRFDVNSKLVITDNDLPVVKKRKRSAMKVAVHRMLQRADALIANVEIGKFPCNDPVPKRSRWTDEQQQRLDAAVANGEWQPRQMKQNDWAAEFAAVHRREESFRQRARERVARFHTEIHHQE